MASFVVETYLSRDAPDEPDRMIARVIAAVDELSASGQAVRYVRSIFMPDDETCLLLFEAETADVIRTAALRAAINADRISRADSRELPISR